MNNHKIKTYGELNVNEKYVMDTLRDMKMGYDKARFRLISYQLTNLITDYEKLMRLREDIQQQFFAVIDEICENELDDVDINVHEYQNIRDTENATWQTELNIISDYKYQIDEGLELLDSGVVEQILMAEDEIGEITHFS